MYNHLTRFVSCHQNSNCFLRKVWEFIEYWSNFSEEAHNTAVAICSEERTDTWQPLTMSDLDWADINSKLPFSREEEEVERRKELWADIDVNGNGFVSLSEVTTVSPGSLGHWQGCEHSDLQGIRDVLKLPEVYDSKLAIITAFNFSKSKCKTTRSHGDDYLEFNEFRFFLQTLRQFFEYYQAFSR